MVGIYKITSPTNKVYIGQSWNIKKRWNGYKYHKNLKQRYLSNSLIKYGSESHQFEVVHELPNDVTQYILDCYEILYCQLYKDCGVGMLNIREAGSRGANSPETRQRMSLALKGRVSPNKGITGIHKHTEEWKQKAKVRLMGNKSRTGQKNTPEAIEKTTATKRGVPRSEETKRKISEAQKGKVLSKESIAKRSATNTGRNHTKKRAPLSAEVRKKMGVANIGRVSPNKGKIGIFKHSDKAKKRISEASKNMWMRHKQL